MDGFIHDLGTLVYWAIGGALAVCAVCALAYALCWVLLIAGRVSVLLYKLTLTIPDHVYKAYVFNIISYRLPYVPMDELNQYHVPGEFSTVTGWGLKAPRAVVRRGQLYFPKEIIRYTSQMNGDAIIEINYRTEAEREGPSLIFTYSTNGRKVEYNMPARLGFPDMSGAALEVRALTYHKADDKNVRLEERVIARAA